MTELTTTRDLTSKPGPKGIPLAAIIDYIENKNLSLTETANLLGCTKSNIKQRLTNHGIIPGYLKKYKENRADILATYQGIILNSLTPNDLKRAGLSQKIMAYGVLYDKERLERGQSTENIAYADMIKVNEQIDKDLAAMRKKLGIDTPEEGVDTPPCIRVDDDKAQDIGEDT